MTRLFTFGCSFTNYRWSTWADCLAPEFDYFENWGQSGAGNHYIFNSIMEADQRYKFDRGDTVIICWSSFLRDDRYVDRKWHTLGNMVSCPIYNPEYLKTHVDDRGYVIRDFAFIKAVKVLLQSKSGLDWRFLSMIDLKAGPKCESDPGEPKDVMTIYADVLASILPSYQEVLYSAGWKKTSDAHPSPAEHLAYLDAVLPGWVTKQSTRVKMQQESINLNKDPRKSGMTKVTRL
jgi:hypothetical protein